MSFSTQTTCDGAWGNYSLNCTWSDPWCYEDVSKKGCSDITNDMDCFDTFYCWWNSTAETCNDPVAGGIETDFQEWNPGCYIFDTAGQALCNNVTGCWWNSSHSLCKENESIIRDGKLNCSLITNSSVCTKMSMLSTCCKWQAGSCTADRFTTECWDNMEEPPEGCYYCEDYVSFTNKDKCEQIAGDPWYMPCKWNNGTERCEFKHANIFTEGRENIMLLDSKQSCESAGGKWITDSYCNTNNDTTAVAIPMGRCEFKFDEERNCDKECYACEHKSDKTNWTSSPKAKEACINSKLGICGFVQDSSAPNSYGYCEPKDAFIKGIATDCDDDCGSCTYMGDPTAAEAEKRPSYFCKNSKNKCKWIPDIDYPTDESKGRCGSTAERTCEDRCDLCYDQEICVNKGGKKGNTSADTACEWDSSVYMCLLKSGGDQMEICWDGTDNNQDGKMDCADSMCWSDPFCGGEFMIGFGGMDCFGYDAQTDCETAGCVWINENWGTWCDMPGAVCWKYDGNQTGCDADGNCTWHSGFGGFCEEDWGVGSNCMSYSNQSDCGDNIASNCTWVQDSYFNSFGGWCEMDPSYSGDTWLDCMQYDDEGQTECETHTQCRWQASAGGGYGGGWCDHMKFACSQFTIQADCTNATNATYNHSKFCTWMGSYCEGKMMSGGSDSCWNYADQTNCEGASCKWVSGFCDPEGFGSDMGMGTVGGAAIGGFGSACFKHDGNQTGCKNQSGCGWFAESSAFCDVSFVSDCPQYSYNATLCNELARCKYNPEMGFCDEKPFECFWNSTLNDAADSTKCDAHDLCAYTAWNTCEPKCFSTPDEETCGSINASGTTTNVCRWVDGWCNPGAAAEFFKGMEGGAPTTLGTDAEEDVTLTEVDISDFGIKDMGMGKAFGLGISVKNVENSSLCNGIKISSGKIGTGQNTTKFYWYLDTNMNATGNCALDHNSSLAGFEFHFRGEWSWDNTTGKATETLEAYRCANASWVKAAIPLQSIKQVACTDIGGGMVAIEKSELEKFPTLYNASADLRVAVATANASGNTTNPTDTIGSSNIGWLTPGAIDQDIDNLDLYKYKLNASQKTGSGSGHGYISYKVDCWTEGGCADYQCQNHTYCVNKSYGVHADNYTDTRVPKIVGIIKETYADSAMITYFTDKPSNGTLINFWADSTCTATNNITHTTAAVHTFPDTGIVNPNVKKYKLWHVAEMYEGGPTINGSYPCPGISDTYGSPLANNVTYYYKLKVCDTNGKCGISKCSKFRTEETNATNCGFCKFVARINTPSSWNVSYDLDQDGTYEHIQCHVCGDKAGMKVNYSNGRRANIRLTEAGNATYIEFINVTLTKTGLGSKIRNIEEGNALASGTTTTSAGATIGYTGMISDTRDKIVNNLHPDKCLIKIPTTGSCDELWHCDDTMTKCVKRSDEATLLVNNTNSSNKYCVWQIPYCEFSTWAGGEPGTPPGSSDGTTGGGSTSGASGSGGAAAAAGGVSASQMWTELKKGETIMSIKKTEIAFSELKMNVKNPGTNVEIKVTKLDDKPDVTTVGGTVYQYIEITKKNIESSDIARADITFKVEKSWLTEQGASEEDVELSRYTTKWEKLPVTKIKSDATYVHYKATTSGFSYFAITLRECIEDWVCGDWGDCSTDSTQTRTCTDSNECGTTEDKPEETQSCVYAEEPEITTAAVEEIPPKPKKKIGWLIFSGVALVGLVVFFVYTRRKEEK